MTIEHNPERYLLTPENHALLLIDHQYLQLLTVTSHQPQAVLNKATALEGGEWLQSSDAADHSFRGPSAPAHGDPGRVSRPEAH